MCLLLWRLWVTAGGDTEKMKNKFDVINMMSRQFSQISKKLAEKLESTRCYLIWPSSPTQNQYYFIQTFLNLNTAKSDLQKILHERFYKFMKPKLFFKQFGFQKKNLTEYPMLDLKESILNNRTKALISCFGENTKPCTSPIFLARA